MPERGIFLTLASMALENPYPNRFPEWLEAKRAQRSVTLRRRLTNGDIAIGTGLSDSGLSIWASGKQRPDPMALIRLAEFFHTDPVELFRIVGHLPPEPTEDPNPIMVAEERAAYDELHHAVEGLDPETIRAVARSATVIRQVREGREAAP